MQANAVVLWGQHVCAEEHSHGSWLQGVDDEPPPLLLEQAATTSESTRAEEVARRMGSALTTTRAALDRGGQHVAAKL